VALLRRHPRNQALPIIFITAFHNDRDLMARGYSLGAVDYITKPFEPDFLRAKVGFFVELHQRGVRLAQQAEQLRENERARAEQHAARLAAELASRAKDEFLAMVSHELRTPLTAIVGWVELLQAGHLDATAQARALEVIRRCGQAQSQLIDDLLDMTRILHGSFLVEKATIDLAEAVAAAVEAVRALARDKQIGIELECQGAPLAVEGDEQRIQQLVWNLVGNAIKFSRPSGLVVVSLRRDGAEAELEVRDHGSGITPELLPQVFERFRQGAGARAGLGLGLSIARHIAEAHGATISAHSAGLNQGATFTVRFPLAKMGG